MVKVTDITTLGTPEIIYHKRRNFFLTDRKKKRAFNFFLKGTDFKFMPVDGNDFTHYTFICVYI